MSIAVLKVVTDPLVRGYAGPAFSRQTPEKSGCATFFVVCANPTADKTVTPMQNKIFFRIRTPRVERSDAVDSYDLGDYRKTIEKAQNYL